MAGAHTAIERLPRRGGRLVAASCVWRPRHDVHFNQSKVVLPSRLRLQNAKNRLCGGHRLAPAPSLGFLGQIGRRLKVIHAPAGQFLSLACSLHVLRAVAWRAALEGKTGVCAGKGTIPASGQYISDNICSRNPLASV